MPASGNRYPARREANTYPPKVTPHAFVLEKHCLQLEDAGLVFTRSASGLTVQRKNEKAFIV
jgi:hypothetical protein